MPLETRLQRIAEAFEPLAAGCAELGCPLGIENHGDFYCSDLVAVNKMAPHVNIFLDTGNTFLAGEKSIEGCRDAAPITIGTHLKDHFVHPDGGTLTFVIEGAALGEGDVGLATVYHDLMRLARAPKLVLHWELVIAKGANALVEMDRSWEFIRTLPGQERAGVLQTEALAVA
jgi:sugar phosphate isomerase/epimerase